MEWEAGRRPGQEEERLREKEGLKWGRSEQPSLKGVQSTSLSRCQWGKPEVSRRVGCAAWGLENKHLRLDLSPDQAETQNLVTWPRRVCKTGGRLPGLWTLSHTGLHHSSSFLPCGPHPVEDRRSSSALFHLALSPHSVSHPSPHQPSLEKQKSQALTERGWRHPRMDAKNRSMKGEI